MGRLEDYRRQELALLSLQLANASRLLDEIERRSLDRRAGSVERLSNLITESSETRFAACVASGMAKIQSGVKPRK